MNEFVTFQSFYTEEEALDIFGVLKEKGIEGKIEKPGELLDRTFIGDNLEKKVFLKIRSDDFQKANKILDARIEQNISALEKDYYLFSFTDNELLEIINKPDEWSRQDFLIAKKILKDRGETIPEEKIEEIKSERIRELENPEKETGSWIAFGYLLALFGIPGIIFGLVIMSSKKILPTGRKVYVYNLNSRNHGRNVLIISGIVLLLAIIKWFTVNLRTY